MGTDPEGRRIREEMEHHLDELRSALEREGLTPEEARREAERRFGDRDRVARQTLRAGGAGTSGAWRGLRSDLVQVGRGLVRAPAFAGGVLITIALTLGAAITVFGVVWDVLLRPLALRDPDALVVLAERMPADGIEGSPTSTGTYHDWRRELTRVQDLVAWEWGSWTHEDPERPEELIGVRIRGDAFAVLGIEAALGRVLAREDEVDGAPATALLLSHGYWTRRFGQDPGIVGRTVRVDGVDRTVVGVLPPRLELIGPDAEIFLPSGLVPEEATNRGGRTVTAVGRLAPGATVADAAREVAALTERIAETYPTSARGWSADAVPLGEFLVGSVRPRLLAASAAVALLVLVALVNLTTLFLVRASDRTRETAVRAALGASRPQLLRIPLLESLLLAGVGGAGGLLLARALSGWVVSTPGLALPRSTTAGLSPLTVLVAALLALGVGLLAGLWPALEGVHRALASLGRGTAGQRTTGRDVRSRHGLVVLQLGLTTVLLIGAGLFVRTVRAVGDVDLGFTPEQTVAARVSIDGERYSDRAAQRAYQDRLLERVRALPGVSAAGLTSALPMDPVAANFDLPTRTSEGTPWGEAAQVDFRMVSDGLDRALGLRVREGRFFAAEDRGGPLVAVVNRTLAEAFWPGESAVGQRIQNVWRQDAFAEVVGVVEDTRFYGPTESPRREMYVPLHQSGFSFLTVVARGEAGADALQAALEQAVVDVDPLLPPQSVFPVATLVSANTATERFYATLLSAFALLALILAAAGIYAVLAYGVRLRTRELGVRMALGASRGAVTAMVLRSGLVLGGIGALLGLLGALPATRLVGGMLYGVSPLDPATWVGVSALLLAVAGLACLSPALRAARLDPARVLQDE
ncbi:MAG: ADOP family duplicated permease [Gemmatimonadota bacterium]